MAAFTARLMRWRVAIARRREVQPVDARGAGLAVGVHDPAHAVGVRGRPVGAATLHGPLAGPEREALVGAHEDDHRVGTALAHLGHREATPVEQVGLRDARSDAASRTTLTPVDAREKARATFASSGWASESPVTRTVRSERGGAGRAPSACGSNASGVTGGTPRSGGARGRLVEAARAGQPVVGVRPADELVLDGREPEGVGHRSRRTPDREDERSLPAGLHLLARVADRAALEGEQQQRAEADADQRVARGEVAARRRCRDRGQRGGGVVGVAQHALRTGSR